MSFLKKEKGRREKTFPSFLRVSFCLLALSLLFLLCYNQSDYMMKSDGNDYLVNTIVFFALITVSTFSDFVFHFSISEENKNKKILMLIPSLLEGVSVLVGFYSYFKAYNETITAIRLPRYIAAVLIVVLWLLGLIDRLLRYNKNMENRENDAKLDSFFSISPFLLSGFISILFPLCVYLTMEMPLSHYCFIFLFIALAVGALAFFVLTLPFLLKAVDEKKRNKSIIIMSFVEALISLSAIIAVTVAYENKAGIAYRSLFWTIASFVAAIMFSALAFLDVYLAQNIDKMPVLEDEDD